MQSNHSLPQDERHPLRQKLSRPQKIENTLLYIQLAEVIFKEITDEFTVRVAKTPEEIKGLLEVGFEYVVEKDGLMFFRRRK